MISKLVIRTRRAKLEIGRVIVADLIVDGSDLRDRIRVAESPFARRENHPELAGAYESLPVRYLAPPSRLLLGQPDDPLLMDDFGRVVLLDCTCGCIGCWPLFARITVSDGRVVWSDFEQRHRGPESCLPLDERWSYGHVRPIAFDLEQYTTAWKSLFPDCGV